MVSPDTEPRHQVQTGHERTQTRDDSWDARVPPAERTDAHRPNWRGCGTFGRLRTRVPRSLQKSHTPPAGVAVCRHCDSAVRTAARGQSDRVVRPAVAAPRQQRPRTRRGRDYRVTPKRVARRMTASEEGRYPGPRASGRCPGACCSATTAAHRASQASLNGAPDSASVPSARLWRLCSSCCGEQVLLFKTCSVGGAEVPLIAELV